MDGVSVAASITESILLGIRVTQSLVDFYSAYKTQDVAYTIKKLEHLLSALEILRSQLTNRRSHADERDLLKNIEGSIQTCDECIQELRCEAVKLEGQTDGIRAAARTAAYRVAYPFRQSTLQKLGEIIDEIALHLSLALQVLRQKDIGSVQDVGECLYSPLPEGSIRLLSLLPHEDTNAPIQCRLFDYPLQVSSQGTHPYEALSYVWGDPNNLRSISINEYDLLITANLHAALLHLRAPFLERMFWVDAICINQTDEAEKGEQIRHMAEIYSRFSLNIRPLGELIDMYHTHEATKRHDKVFALLGMSVDNPSASGLSLNYTVPWETLFNQLIKLLLSSQVSVKIWAEMTAVIEGKGCILGKVSSVDREDRDDRQQVAIASKDATGYLRHKRKWTLQPSAKSVQAGDLVCLLRGALKPTVIRPCKDHFSVVMIAAPLKDIGTGDTEHLNGDIGHLDKRTRLWDVALILEEAEEYEKADERLRDAVEIYKRESGAEDPHTRISKEKRKMKQWEKEKMKLLLEQRGDGVPITETVAVAAAKNEKNGEAMMRVLFEQRGDGVPITETVAVAAVKNEKSGGAVMRLLLEQRRDAARITNPLSWAVAKGFEAVVRLLLKNGADPEARDESGPTPLMRAVKSGHVAVVKLLLEKGAYLEAKDGYGKTPLSWSAENGHEAVIKLLIEKGAYLGEENKWGETPLILAAQSGHEAVVKLLLEKGAYLETKNNGRQTPLMLAAKNGHEAVVKLLLEKGAYLETKNMWGETPLKLAAQGGHKAVARLLLEKGARKG
ncbi:hypothetical protein DL771_006080 [Monosporascus sp. 5C6A]|nr:hypothetical protein DL771_006080 [Monosporascus sp. 5C6A]